MGEVWPALPLDAWRDTYATLHMWTQIVGKTRLALAPPVNHWWQVAQYVTSKGLTTSSIPHGHRTFEVEFDFVDHILLVTVSDGSAGDHAAASTNSGGVLQGVHEPAWLTRLAGEDLADAGRDRKLSPIPGRPDSSLL